MFVELIESLRCPQAHEPAALVVSTSNVVQRHIVDATLGCPICGSEFVVRGGVAAFDEGVSRPQSEAPSDEVAMRLAAFLDLTDASGFAVLAGRRASHADRVGRLADTPLVLLNPPADVPPDVAAAIIVARDVFPFAAASARGAALDHGMSPSLVRSVVDAVRGNGRVMGPAEIALPAGVVEISRDSRDWVGQKAAAQTPPRLVPIARARS